MLLRFSGICDYIITPVFVFVHTKSKICIDFFVERGYYISMILNVKVTSSAYDSEYGGEQELYVERGEYLLDDIFRLPFFRIIIDDVIDGAVCFRLMEGAVAHYFVLEKAGDTASFERETSIGGDEFIFTLTA